MESHNFTYKGGIYSTVNYDGGTGNTTYSTSLNRSDYSNVFTVITDTSTWDRTKPHPCSFTKHVHHYMGADYHRTSLSSGQYGPSWQHAYGRQGNPATGGLNVYNAYSPATYNKCLSELNSKIRGDLDLLIDLMEREATVKMVTPAVKICHGFVNVVNFVHNISRHGLDKQNLDKIASAWLQYTYGVRPLVNSMYGFMEKLRDERRGKLKIYARSRIENKWQSGGTPLTYSSLLSEIADVDRCLLSVTIDLKPDVYTTLAGISSLNPISLAWELLPYSFVIDWVFDIGSYLSNVESAFMYDRFFDSGFKTLTSKRNIQSRYPDTEMVSAGYRHRLAGFGNSLGLKKDRSVLTGFPVAFPPVLHCDLGWRRIVSATALAYGALRRTGVDVGRHPSD